MANPSDICSLIEKLIYVLVDHPKKASISMVVSETSICYRVYVDESDIQNIIEPHGETIRAIRVALAALRRPGRQKFTILIASNDAAP